MKIAFIMPTQFNILSPFQQPLGGSESAVSYLAIELARLGHIVNIYSRTPFPIKAMGVNCVPLMEQNNSLGLPNDALTFAADVYIFKNGLLELIPILKNKLNNNQKIIFWTGHSYDQPAVQILNNPEIQQAVHAIACVSNWHRDCFIKQFKLDEKKVVVHRNAISPFFENLFLNEEELLAVKPSSPSLAYTPTPFRGLDVLLQLFPELQKAIPESTLAVYSSLKVYGIDQAADNFQHLYKMAKEIKNCEYIGSLPQVELASSLRKNNIFSYPSTFAETSCISVMEAMAAGLWVVTTELGALKETSLGLGDIITVNEQGKFVAQEYSDALITRATSINNEPDATAKKLYEQSVLINREHTWRVRARTWLRLLERGEYSYA